MEVSSRRNRNQKKPPPPSNDVVDLTEDEPPNDNDGTGKSVRPKQKRKRDQGNEVAAAGVVDGDNVICIIDDDDHDDDVKEGVFKRNLFPHKRRRRGWDGLNVASKTPVSSLVAAMPSAARVATTAAAASTGTQDGYDRNDDLEEEIIRKRPRKKRRKHRTSSPHPSTSTTESSVSVAPAAQATTKRHRTLNFATGRASHQGDEEECLYLDDSVRGGNLNHEKKSEHFKDARRPEKILKEEIEHLQDQLRKICRDKQRLEWQICKQQIDELQAELDLTRKNAAQDIYNRNNSDGHKGIVNTFGKLEVDFHGFYVKEAIDRFEDMIAPILPVQKEICIVTGRGRHSNNGKSVLRAGLLQHIQKRASEFSEGKLDCYVDKKNRGVINLRYYS